jgi:hypothetical protein
LSVFQRDIEVNAHEDFFGGDIEVADGKLRHGGEMH